MIDYQIGIRKLIIKNFRAIKSLELELNGAPIATLAGRNGSGKTSILEAINIALSEKSSRFTDIKESDFHNEQPIEIHIEFDKPFFFEFDYPTTNHSGLIPCFALTKTVDRRRTKERGKFFSSEYEVKIDYNIQNYNPSSAEYEALKNQIESSKPSINHHLVREFSISEEGLCRYRTSSDTMGNFKDMPEGKQHTSSFKYNIFPKVLFPQVFYYDNNRSRELLPQYNTAFSNVTTELNWQFKREFMKDVNVQKKDEIIQAYEDVHNKLNNIDNHEQELIQPAINILKNELSVELEPELKMLVFSLYQPFASPLFGYMSEENQGVAATSLGSGISTLLALCLAISFSESSKVPIIILIDEPELHLHADLQKNLFKLLKTKGFQAILSTHSHLFLDKENITNNYILETTATKDIEVKQTTGIELADLQFRLLGNSLDDLYIPEVILIVEGPHDKQILIKCFELLTHQGTQIVEAGGKDNIPDKSIEYDKVIAEILKKGSWYSSAIIKKLKILVDGDVTVGKVNHWCATYGLNVAEQIQHLDPTNKLCFEYYYPEVLIKSCVENTKLSDGTMLKDKSGAEIVKIILADDKEKRVANHLQIENRVSKQRFNEFIAKNLTLEILNAPDGQKLKGIAEWAKAMVSETTP